jgi:hypothetical protein
MATASTTKSIFTSIEAAKWAAKFYVGKPSILRYVAALAGKVTSQPGALQPEVVAAWVFYPCESQVRDNADQECFFQEIEERCGPDVGRIVREVVAPFKSTSAQIKQHFRLAGFAAKRIRVAEAIMALQTASYTMIGGAMVKVEEVRENLDWAKFVYENSREIPKQILHELGILIVSVDQMWNTIASTMESFEKTIGSPEMVPVKLMVVANDLGTVGISRYEGAPETKQMRAAFDDIRKSLGGGSLFSETLLHATVPLPKVDVIKPVAVNRSSADQADFEHSKPGHDETDCNCGGCQDLNK